MSSDESQDEEVQFTFTEEQLLILHEEKDSYCDTKKKLHQKKVNEIFKCMKALDNEDKEISSKKDAVLMAILAWLQHYAQRKTKEKGFLEPWTLRRVVGIEREPDVLRVRDWKFAEVQRAESAKVNEDGTDGDDENEASNQAKKKPNAKKRHQKDKAFNYYQAAVSKVMVNITWFDQK
ncbi:uncharacterized protein LACBIDRAFT_322404 [Laccaria bicolor S238N-H82]|uniref:Predicted protein n=1 Tax=Laccaria bicolor (strain S238N-H82 / ATCC MYA-4686) TaxID=486041 RepID=B0CW60_LACBS|nr:uncharacterized protein LACBIDRAFT_322404 [Laccaria bicolor S238N-H82]EDR13010.1 predicted protein [Laccaria bicolor S238N-H82]|eukprot:XP_001875508.1 predicted protein [Laccaria bicolor S238N-H82]